MSAPVCLTCQRPVYDVALFRTAPTGTAPANWKCAACLTEEDRRQIAANETARKCRALANETRKPP